VGEETKKLLWRIRLNWWGLCKRLYHKYEDNEVGEGAAAISYYLIFSLFPFLFFLATLTGYIPYTRASADTLLERARTFLPPEAMGSSGRTYVNWWPSQAAPADPGPRSGGLLRVLRGGRPTQGIEPRLRRQGVPPALEDLAACVRHGGRGRPARAGWNRPARGGRQRRVVGGPLSHIADEYVIVIRWIVGRSSQS